MNWKEEENNEKAGGLVRFAGRTSYLAVRLSNGGAVEDSPAPQSVSVDRPQSQPEQSQPEPETRTAVLCINYIGHPILRIVQRGFSDSAQQLGYEWHVVGLADGSSEQMHAEWLRGVEQYDADGALCWVGDDSGYEF